MLDYSIIEIFTSEESRHLNRPVGEAVVNYIQSQRLAARCMVCRGEIGCYENGDIVTRNLELLSFNMPVRITIVLPSAELDRVMDGLVSICPEGIVTSHQVKVHSHRVPGGFFPRQLLVRDVMTRNPTCVRLSDSGEQAARALLGSIFTGLPVTDEAGKPMGIITQGDLIQRGDLPIRIRLLEKGDDRETSHLLSRLSAIPAKDLMTSPVITIEDHRHLTEAVELMLEKKVKRLPVTDDRGRLSGILSRLDIFRTVMHRGPDWKRFAAQEITVDAMQTVEALLRDDSRTVSPDTTAEELIQTIDGDDLQMVAVVDEQGHLLGGISDLDLLHFFRSEPGGALSLFGRLKQSLAGEQHPDLASRLRRTRAEDLMDRDIVRVRETTRINDAIELMTTRAIKRLMVIDQDNRFLGMISRDSLLRSGYRKVSS